MILTTNTARETSLSDIGKIILEANKILLITHYRPDGDAIGSSIALASSLSRLGKEVLCLNRDETPNYLRFLENEEISMQQEIPSEWQAADLIIALDCATIERLGADQVAALPNATVLTIDHHITNERYGNHLLLNDKAAATGEILH